MSVLYVWMLWGRERDIFPPVLWKMMEHVFLLSMLRQINNLYKGTTWIHQNIRNSNKSVPFLRLKSVSKPLFYEIRNEQLHVIRYKKYLKSQMCYPEQGKWNTDIRNNFNALQHWQKKGNENSHPYSPDICSASPMLSSTSKIGLLF